MAQIPSPFSSIAIVVFIIVSPKTLKMLHHQHHHSMATASPARLGLPNPTSSSSSPSLPPNPIPKPQPPPTTSSSSSSSPSPSTSTTLLSLLPPLPRAQSLLLQMSSLVSKLFEISPNRSLWSSSYRSSLPSFLPNSPPISSSSISSTKDILSLFHSLQTSLFESVAQLQEILDLQDSTTSLSRHIRAADNSLLSFATKLQESESLLDRLVDDYSHLYRPHPPLPLTDLLAYAHRISYTTFAPPEHGAGLAPLRGALPPAPQDNEMRASQLYHFADLDVGVPVKKKAKMEEAVGAVGVEDDVLMEPTQMREVEVLPGAMLPIAVPPPGWKKGMPVELPPMPPGWKPGDPVPLPPVPPVGWKVGDPVPLPPMLDGKEEERVQVQQTRGVQKMPEAIQVKYVQLDIPEEDDYSSYSSEVGSSDEDEEE